MGPPGGTVQEVVDKARELKLDPDIDGAKKGRNTYFKKVMTNMEQFVSLGKGVFTLKAYAEGRQIQPDSQEWIQIGAPPEESGGARDLSAAVVPRAVPQPTSSLGWEGDTARAASQRGAGEA